MHSHSHARPRDHPFVLEPLNTLSPSQTHSEKHGSGGAFSLHSGGIGNNLHPQCPGSGTNAAFSMGVSHAHSNSHTRDHSIGGHHGHGSRTPPRRPSPRRHSHPGGTTNTLAINPFAGLHISPQAQSARGGFSPNRSNSPTEFCRTMWHSKGLLGFVAALFLFAAMWHLGSGGGPVLRLVRPGSGGSTKAPTTLMVASILNRDEPTTQPDAHARDQSHSRTHQHTKQDTAEPSSLSHAIPAFAAVGTEAVLPPLPAAASIVARDSEPRLLVRIVTKGQQGHLSLSRLLDSLQNAEYETGTDLIDLEILIDWPEVLSKGLVLTLATKTMEDGSGMEDAATLDPNLQYQRAALLRDPEYMQAKYEYDLTLLIARNFHWVHGTVNVRPVDPTTAYLGGFFHSWTSWLPNGSGGEEYSLLLMDDNVLSTKWFQIAKRMIKRYWMNGGGLVASTKLIAFQLEPSELFLGSDPLQSTWHTRTPESYVEAAFGAGEMHLLFSQAIASPTGLGGLLFRSRAWMEFKSWLVSSSRLLTKDPLGALASQDYGAPVALVYDRLQSGSMESTCVPGVISNTWVPLIEPLESMESREKKHQSRIENVWFSVQVLHRWMYESGSFVGTPFFKRSGGSASSGTTPSLLTSSAFILPHSHHDVTNHPVGEPLHEDAHLHGGQEEFIPLPPLRRDLVKNIDISQIELSMRHISVVHDFSGRAVLLESLSSLEHPAGVRDSAACGGLPSGAPSTPPSQEPTQEQRDQIQKQIDERRKANAALHAPAVNPEASTGSAEPDGPPMPIDLKGLSQADLLKVALKTAEAHTSDLTVSPLLKSKPDESLPLLPMDHLHDNLTSIETKRWEDHEAEFQFALQRLAADPKATEAAMKQHEQQRQEHEEHLAHIREELEKKQLVEKLKAQMAEIEEREEDEKIEQKLKKFREKKQRLKEAEKKKEKSKGTSEKDKEKDSSKDKSKEKSDKNDKSKKSEGDKDKKSDDDKKKSADKKASDEKKKSDDKKLADKKKDDDKNSADKEDEDKKSAENRKSNEKAKTDGEKEKKKSDEKKKQKNDSDAESKKKDSDRSKSDAKKDSKTDKSKKDEPRKPADNKQPTDSASKKTEKDSTKEDKSATSEKEKSDNQAEAEADDSNQEEAETNSVPSTTSPSPLSISDDGDLDDEEYERLVAEQKLKRRLKNKRKTNPLTLSRGG